MNAKNVDV